MNFVYELLQLLYGFAGSFAALVADTFNGTLYAVDGALSAVLYNWGYDVGQYGFWVPLLIVAGLGVTASVSYAVLDLTDGARAALGY